MTGVPDFVGAALTPEKWPAFVLLTGRLGGLMLTAPAWSGTTMPRLIRTALTVVLAVLLLPAAPAVALPEHVLDLPLPMAAEIAIGLVIGLAAAVLVQAVGLAGEVMSMQMGLSIAPALAPVPELEVVGIGPLATTLALLIYLMLGGHLMLLRGLADSLHTLPPGAGIVFTGGGPVAAALAGQMFSCAASVAAPVMVTLLLTNIALAMLSRAVPQLNAMMVSFPLTIGAGLLMFAVSLPNVSSVVAGWVLELPASVNGLLVPFQQH
jgi:flagellar biosynthetic protein FliR